MYRLFFRNIAAQVRIGIHPFEREGPQRLLVSVETFLADASPADHIDHVVDYDDVRAATLRVAAARHYDLQETLCDALLEEIRRLDARIGAVVVTTAKPDIYHDVEQVGCTKRWLSDPALAVEVALLRAAP
jgi:dihydroneopterin aldolase